MIFRRLFLFMTISAAFLILSGSVIAGTVPGTGGDPLITKGWVNRYVQKAFSPLADEVSDLTKNVDSLSSQARQVRPVLILTVGSKRGLVGKRPVDLEIPPLVIGSRIFLPLRFVGESLGVPFQWDGEIKKISYTAKGKQVELVIGRKTANLGGAAVPLDAPATVRDGRTLVPLRFIGESLGADVIWHGETKTVEIR